MIIDIVKGLISPLTDIYKNHQARKKAKLDSDLKVHEAQTEAKIDRLKTGQNADIKWDNLSIQRGGWKDEYLTIVITLPAILCFIPGMVDYVRAGFAALAETPLWYQKVFMVVVASAFGVKEVIKFIKLKRGD